VRQNLLFYEYVEDIVERRGPHREAHLEGLRSEREAGRLVMAGALGDPPNGAAIVFADVEREAIENYVKGDPYVRAGLVKNWRIEPWNVVV
jgi:uncharacterized protein